jgi:hypothetical protein
MIKYLKVEMSQRATSIYLPYLHTNPRQGYILLNGDNDHKIRGVGK